jgi:hypothetical protein
MLAMLVTVSGSLAAQSEPVSTTANDPKAAARDEAQRRFARGLDMAQRARDWTGALAEFLASRELYPTRSATRNAAIALRELRRYAEAYTLYHKLLTEFAADMPADQLQAARRELEQYERLAGKLDLRAAEPGALLVVDGEPIGMLPLSKPLVVDPGRHTLRITKAGFEPFELRVSLAGGELRRVDAKLVRLAPTGELVVMEQAGAALNVVIDGVVVGVAPWRGKLAPGVHSIWLQGVSKLGTAPSAAQVETGRTTQLTLRAAVLDSSLRVASNTPDATVFVDGVSVGSSHWTGVLPSGAHRVDVVARNHRAFGKVVQLTPGEQAVVHAELQRDTPGSDQDGHFYLHARAGMLLAATLNGDADRHCACSDRTRPLGAIGSFHAGYAFWRGLSVELGVGYLTIAERLQRELTAKGEGTALDAHGYRDTTRLAGPFFGVDLGYRLLERTPLTARLGAGLALLRSATAGSGVFQGKLVNPLNPDEKIDYGGRVDVDELERLLVTPFVATELRFGYRLTRRWAIDLGLAATLFLPAQLARSGATTYSTDDTRVAELPATDQVWSDGTSVKPGNLSLPHERVAGAFVALSPTIGARLDF